jgi:hypothetical protein
LEGCRHRRRGGLSLDFNYNMVWEEIQELYLNDSDKVIQKININTFIEMLVMDNNIYLFINNSSPLFLCFTYT